MKYFPDKIHQNTQNSKHNQCVLFYHCAQNQDVSSKNDKISYPQIFGYQFHQIVNEYKEKDINKNGITIKQHKEVLKDQSVKVLQK